MRGPAAGVRGIHYLLNMTSGYKRLWRVRVEVPRVQRIPCKPLGATITRIEGAHMG